MWVVLVEFSGIGVFQPHHVAARKIIDDGAIGRPVSVRISHNHGTIDTFAAGDWYREAIEGGPELSLGWYVIDVLRGLLGTRPTRVFAEYGNFVSPDSPFMDHGKILMRFDENTIASCDLYFSNRFPFPTWDLEVIGTEGALRTHAGAQQDGVPPAVLWTKDGPTEIPVPEGDFWTADTSAWVAAFAADRPHQIDAEEARTITEISLACREAAQQKRAVDL